MNKGKRLGIIIGTAILSIILVVIFSTVAVKSTTVKKSVNLGNKYLSEGNYEEAIIAFEKAIKIDSKNIEIKETLDVLYIYEEAIKLISEGERDKAQEKLEEIKDKPKFDIIKDYVNEVEEELEVNLNGLGNSYVNIISQGLVAYNNQYVFYSNLEDEGKLYKMKIDSGETTKLCDDKVKYINTYKKYIYYMVDNDLKVNNQHIYEVKKISTDGTENEVVVNKNENATEFQIIDGILYYNKYCPEEVEFGVSRRKDIIGINLETMVSKRITTAYSGYSILRKNSNNKLDLIRNAGQYLYINKDITGSNEEELIKSGYLSLRGVTNDSILYLQVNSDNVVYELITTDNNKVKLFENKVAGATILGNNNIYIQIDDKLIAINKTTGNKSVIKEISMKDLSSFFEVKGYLTYYDENNKLIIDREVNLVD